MKKAWMSVLVLASATASLQAQGACQWQWKAAPGAWDHPSPAAEDEWLLASVNYNGQIVLGGLFPKVFSTPVNNITRWNGSAWDAMGQGLTSSVPYAAAVQDLMVVDGALWASGAFTASGPVALAGLAKWNGASWESIEHGASGPVTAMGMYQGQPVIARWDETSKTSSVARREGGVWVALGGAQPWPIRAFAVYQGELHLGGGDCCDTLEGMFRRWTGSTWQAIDVPLYHIREFTEWNGSLVIASDVMGVSGLGMVYLWDGSNATLIGYFDLGVDYILTQRVTTFAGRLLEGSTGSPAPTYEGFGLLEWTGTDWRTPAGGINWATNDLAHAAQFVELNGELHVFGAFTQAGNLSVGNWAILTCACSADCDASGSLDIDDFICFQTLFAIGDPSADCDESGVLSIDDFICFQTAFAVGC